MSGVRIRALVLAAIVLIALVVLFFLLRPGSPAPESGDVAEKQEEVVAVAINGGIMSPPEVTTYEGELVTLQIISDRPTEFHLHGYDLTEEVEPEETAELSFEATDTGRFAIEDHNTDAEIGVLLVQPL